MIKTVLIILVAILILGAVYLFVKKPQIVQQATSVVDKVQSAANPLSLSAMRSKDYPGSDLVVEQTLADGSNYKQYIASYKSEQLKIYGLLTVPKGEKPQGGFPVIIFNHGYIPPDQYKTTERYVAYVDYFARSGYIVFKSDYRGNGKSEGQPEGAYYSPAYATDVLNAISTLKKYQDANGAKIGMWGHSMGGNITLRDLEISPDIKVSVIWGGVVGSYDDLVNNWRRRSPYVPSSPELALRNRGRQSLIDQYGNPSTATDFWKSIDPTYNLNYINAPVQLHAGLADEEVPYDFSTSLADKLKAAGKTAEVYTYPGADHNISGSAFNLAMQRSLAFFDKYLKN